MLENNKVK